MVLIITHKEDYTADFVINKLNEQKIPYFRFNCEDCLKEDITLRFGFQGGHKILGNEKFTSVWYRRTKLPHLTGLPDAERSYLLAEIDTFLSNLFGIIKAKWLSNPHAVRLAENKFQQLTAAQEVGLKIPRTIVTTSKESIVQFYKSNVQTIVKPINSGRIDYPDNTSKLIFTSVIDESTINNIEEFDVTPCLYQEYIDKEYEVRLTFVGDQSFAARVNSQSSAAAKVDWRRTRLPFERCDVPDDLLAKCRAMLTKLGIQFGAFDFVKSKDGQYYFLEVNPNGQWVWIETDTGLCISDAIVTYLTC